MIVSKLLSFSDRSALEAVSRRWRSASQQCPSPPLPIILNADLTMTNVFAEGPGSAPLQMSSNVRHPRDHQITCLGSLGSLIIMAYDYWNPNVNLALPHTHCVLVQPLNGSTFKLPSPCAFELEGLSISVPIVGAAGRFNFYQPLKACALRLKKGIVSQSTSPSDCIVAALATERGAHHLVFTTPVMSSWYILSAEFITIGADIEFLGDKIIVLGGNQEEVYQIDFGPDLSFFPIVCEIKRCLVLNLPQVEDTQQQLNLIRAGDDLLVVARYFTLNWDQLTEVRLYQLDPIGWTVKQIHTLGERSILVSLSSSQSIAAVSGEIDPKADHLYFLDLYCPHFFPGEEDNFSYRSQVYNMRDGAITELLIGTGRGSRGPGFPMWIFP
ncbi:unnamed protein product [Alopecurus aequalis]